MNRSRSGYVYIVLCAVIFSTMEVMLKTVHGVFAPMQITCLRFLVGGILLIPFASRSMKKKNASLSRKDIGFFALSGFLCVVIAMSLYQMSVTYTRASIVAVIFSCNPIFVTVFAHLFLHEDIHRNHIIALILELTAALIIIDPIHATLDPTGSVLAILSAVMFALYSVFGKKRTPRFGGIAVTCLSFLFGAGELVFILLFGRTAAENCQMSHRCEKPSMPRSASGFRYSGSKTIFARSAGTSPLWRGMPNFSGKSEWILAMTFIV